ARPVLGDLHATADRKLMTFGASPDEAKWAVYAGESFDLWTPETGRIYAVGSNDKVCAHLQKRRARAARQKRSAFHAVDRAVTKDPKTLSCRFARIAFRDVARSTDSRTVRVALVPPNVFL